MSMKKMLFFATLVACSMLFFSCGKQNTPADPNAEAIAKVKAEAMGSWKGNLISLAPGKEGEEVTVTFSENKITTTGNLTVNITAWKCVDGEDVWVEMDDEMKSAMYVKVNGEKMYLNGNSSFIVSNFPPELERVK